MSRALLWTNPSKGNDCLAGPVPISGFGLRTLALPPPIPRGQNVLYQRIQLWFEVLPVGMLAQPAHRFTDALAERRAAAELRHEALDLRVVVHAWVCLVPFERAGHLRRHLADEIGRHLHDLRRLRPQRRRYLCINLVPGKHLVARDVEGLADGLP